MQNFKTLFSALLLSLLLWSAQAGEVIDLIPSATISVSGTKDDKVSQPELVRDGSTSSSSKEKCWLSAKSDAPYIEFSWDSPKRASQLQVFSGYRKKDKKWDRVARGFELQYETPKGWIRVPGGVARENEEEELSLPLYPVAFKKLRLLVSDTPYDEACLREVKIFSWDMSKRPAKPVSIGAKKFPEVVLRNAYEVVRLQYGIRPSGRKPIPYAQLRDEASGGNAVYILTGEVREVDGMKEVLVGKRGWVKTRKLHKYKVGDYVKFVVQLSNRKRSSNRSAGSKDKSLKRVYNDLTMNYTEFIQFLQKGEPFPELEDILER